MSSSEYKVHKILNNNVILAVDQFDRQEVILIGKGIGFCCKVNQVVSFEEHQVDKIFLTYDEKFKRDFYKLIKQFNSSVIGISEEIISLAEKKLGEFNPHIHITLTDHICFSIERIKAGQKINNPFLHEIQMLYKREYEVAKQAIEKIDKEFALEMPEDETGFIALHLHSLSQNKKVAKTIKFMSLIHKLVAIIEDNLAILFDRSDFSYYRLITHLRFTIERVERGKSIKNPLIEAIKRDYKDAYKVAEIIGQEIENKIEKQVKESELGYIALHLQRLTLLEEE